MLWLLRNDLRFPRAEMMMLILQQTSTMRRWRNDGAELLLSCLPADTDGSCSSQADEVGS
jgi:hypothetical protein